MVALPTQAGPSQTITASIVWLEQFSAKLFDTMHDGAESALELNDHVASLLHLYGRLESLHRNWVSQLPAGDLSAGTRQIMKEYADDFRKWHALSVRIGSLAARMKKLGYDVPGVEELQDRIGFCPYVGISIDEWISRHREDDGPGIPLEEVRRGLRNRAQTEGC